MSKKDNTTTNRRDRHQQRSSKSFYKRLAICTTIVYLVIVALTLLGVVHPFGASCTSPLSRFIYQSTRHSSQAQAATCPESSGSDCNTGYYDSVLVATYNIGPFECEHGLISLLVCGILPICVVIALIVARIYCWKLHHKWSYNLYQHRRSVRSHNSRDPCKYTLSALFDGSTDGNARIDQYNIAILCHSSNCAVYRRQTNLASH